MASAAVMSPPRQPSDDPPLPTPVMRLESIFERTSASPEAMHLSTPFGEQQQRHHHQQQQQQYQQQKQQQNQQQHRGNAVADMRGRDASPPPHNSHNAARAASASPSPEPRARSASSGSGSDGDEAAADATAGRAFRAGTARRSPFGGAASMSLDAGPLLSPAPGESFNDGGGGGGGGYRLAGVGRGVGGRSPSPLRCFQQPAAWGTLTRDRRRGSTAVSMSIVREAAPHGARAAPNGGGGRPRGRARSSSVLRAPSGEHPGC